MLEEKLSTVYTKIKMNFYREVLAGFENREASLSTVEVFCIEIIHSLGRPTVNEFASYVNISPQNATYKVNSLIKKGYLDREQSSEDKREYHLEVTPKFYKYFNMSLLYIKKIVSRMKDTFSKKEISLFENMLDVLTKELMPEVGDIEKRTEDIV